MLVAPRPASITVANASPRKHLQKITGFFDGEHNYWKIIVASKRNGGPIHDLEVPRQHLAVGQPVVATALGSFLGSAE